MILFKRRYCRKHGHDMDPDPGDFVLYCRRCKAMVDMHELAAALGMGLVPNEPTNREKPTREAHLERLDALHEADPDHCGGDCYRAELILAAVERCPHCKSEVCCEDRTSCCSCGANRRCPCYLHYRPPTEAFGPCICECDVHEGVLFAPQDTTPGVPQ